MSSRFITTEEAIELTHKGLERWEKDEANAIAKINENIREAAASGRSSILLNGNTISYGDGPLLDRSGTKLLMSSKMMETLRADGYEVSNPHMGYKPDDKGGYEVTMMISWRKRSVPITA